MNPGRSGASALASSLIRATALVAIFPAWPAAAQDWKPARNVEIVVSSGAGGASDRQARTVQRLLQSVPGIPSVTVNNKPGGGGAVALTVLTQHPGDAHYMYVMQTGILANRIVGTNSIGHHDLTPLNTLMREHIVVWVKADSPVTSARDLIARMQRDPAALSFGFSGTRGNQNHILIGMMAKAAGIDPKAVKAVVYSSGAQGITTTLGGHLDIWVGSAISIVPHMQGGTARVLGIGAAQRQPGPLGAVPTLREQGIDAAYSDTRGFIGPKGLTPAQVEYWDQVFARLVEDEAWKQDLEKNAWAADFRRAAEARRYLDAEYEVLEKMLADLGLVKR